MIKTKIQPAHRISVDTTFTKLEGTRGYDFQEATSMSILRGENRIEYDVTPPTYENVYPWHYCVHTRNRGGDPRAAKLGWVHRFYQGPLNGGMRTERYAVVDDEPLPALPSASWDGSCLQGISDQIDLNSRDNVLLYSGVVQAVPLLGSVFKLNHILRKIAKRTSKSFRRKPFTTVIKSMISADFIDRFVISPTLDDAKRFQDACDYTLRVLQTAHDRNEHRIGLRSKVKTVERDDENTVRYQNGNTYGVDITYRTRAMTESQAFMLMDVRYDMMAVAPLKVWAQRVGLTRPLDSIWDLVPFSFVMDYFSRAGDFVSHVSDQMSQVEGLKGKIAKVYDLWGTYKATVVREVKTAHMYQHKSPYAGSYEVGSYCTPGGVTNKSEYFTRFRLQDDPFSYLSSLSRSENWGRLSLDLRATQKRTLAELFIQAKLKS